MKENILREILTKHAGPGGTPLFKNASDLAAHIVKLPNSGYKVTPKDERSVAAFVSQVFRGDRSCSTKLEGLLVEAVKVRLGKEKPATVQKWCDAIHDAIQKQNQAYETEDSGVGPAPDSETLYAELLTTAKQAKLQFIVTSATLEEDMASKRADDLREILIARLRLHPSSVASKNSPKTPASQGPFEPECQYIFLLPGEGFARGFWKNLYARLAAAAQTANSPAPEAISQILDDRDRRDFLQVHVAESSAICGVPIVVFDPDQKRPDPTAFSFCFDEHDRIWIMKWDAEASSAWKTHVYRQFTNDLFKHRRYRWENAKQFIDEFAEAQTQSTTN